MPSRYVESGRVLGLVCICGVLTAVVAECSGDRPLAPAHVDAPVTVAPAASINVSLIKSNYTCGNYFRIRNSNTSSATLSYAVAGTSETGTVALPALPSAYPYSETYLLTKAKGTVYLSYNGARIATISNSGSTCATVASKGFFTNPTTWRSPTRSDGIVAIHAVMLPNGNVMSWGRAEVTPAEWPQIWDPHTDSMAAHPQAQFPVPANKYPDASNWFQTLSDLFCSGQSLLPDGRLLVVGGHRAGTNANHGLSIAFTFDYRTNTWTQLADMLSSRWYPTVTILPDGEALVHGGLNTAFDAATGDSITVPDTIPEILQSDNTWRELSTARNREGYWAWDFVAPDGRVYMAGNSGATGFLSLSGTGGWIGGPTHIFTGWRDYGSAIMYDAGKIMVVGGGHTLNTAELIDLNSTGPKWTSTASMVYPRRQMSAAIQADGKILATGGSAGPQAVPPTNIAYVAEAWDPATQKWSELASLHKERLYHSNSLLLTDGRVLVVGGGEPATTGFRDERNAEFYYPPYLYNPDGTPVTASRPIITSAPTAVGYAAKFAVQTQNVVAAKVLWIRIPAVTHAFDHSQRANYLSFTQSGGTLTVTSPANSDVSPPGFYQLFVLNAHGTPSASRIIQIP